MTTENTSNKTNNQPEARSIPQRLHKAIKKKSKKAWKTIKKKSKKLYKRHPNFVRFVLLPTAVFAFYLGFIQSERFVSQTTVVIRANSSNEQSISGLPLITTQSPTEKDTYLLKNFIRSPGMLTLLNNSFKDEPLKTHYQSPHIDVFSKLHSFSSQEDFLKFYQNLVRVDYDTLSSELKIHVQDFDAHSARAVLEAMLKHSADFVNKVSHDLAKKRLAFSHKQMTDAERKFRDIQDKILHFQAHHGLASPETDVTATSQVLANLKEQLTEKQVKLIKYRTYLNESASQITSLKQEISALQEQINTENIKLIGPHQSGGDHNLSEVNAQFRWLTLDLKFAETEYNAAKAAYEQAKIDISKEINQLIVISKPTLPEEARYPRVAYNLATWFLVLALLYSLGKMVISIIKEHED